MTTNLTDAATQFVSVWSHQDTADQTSSALQCVEIDALVDLLRAAGATTTTLTIWLEAHTDSDPECQGHRAPTGAAPSPST